MAAQILSGHNFYMRYKYISFTFNYECKNII